MQSFMPVYCKKSLYEKSTMQFLLDRLTWSILSVWKGLFRVSSQSS